MRRSRFGFGTAAFALAGTVGALMLIPGEPSSEAKTAPTIQATFAPSPELSNFLDNAIDPAGSKQTSDQVIADVAAAPEAVEVDVAAAAPTAPVQGLALPEAADMTVTASIASSRETKSARTAVNMRAGPSTSYSTLFVLQPDEQVAVLERDGKWTKVEKRDGATGWVYGSYLSDSDEDSMATAAATSATEPVRSEPVRAPEPVREARVEPRQLEVVEAAPTRRSFFDVRRSSRMESRRGGSELAAIRLRAGPSSRSETIATIEAGTPLRIAEKRRGWARVVIPGGISGWVRTN